MSSIIFTKLKKLFFMSKKIPGYLAKGTRVTNKIESLEGGFILFGLHQKNSSLGLKVIWNLQILTFHLML